MTKTIKFNLTLDKHPIRDLEDLLANFNLDDLLTAYHNQQLLHRWLEVRGLDTELKQLMAIQSHDEYKVASELCKLFHAHLSEAEIKAAVHPIVFRGQQKQQLNQLAELQFSRDEVIKKYHSGYDSLCESMLEKSTDYPFLKAAIDVLWKDYAQLFSVDFDLFFAIFIKKSPLTLFAMLGNEVYRQSGLFDQTRKDILFKCVPNTTECSALTESPYQFFSGITDSYWKDLVSKDKKCLILRMQQGNFIRNATRNGEELQLNDVNSQFLILDGIDYKSNNANHTLVYMVI